MLIPAGLLNPVLKFPCRSFPCLTPAPVSSVENLSEWPCHSPAVFVYSVRVSEAARILDSSTKAIRKLRNY
jgi:hypothetical protein